MTEPPKNRLRIYLALLMDDGVAAHWDQHEFQKTRACDDSVITALVVPGPIDHLGFTVGSTGELRCGEVGGQDPEKVVGRYRIAAMTSGSIASSIVLDQIA